MLLITANDVALTPSSDWKACQCCSCVSAPERRFKRANKNPLPFPVEKEILSISHDKEKVPFPSPCGFIMTSIRILIVKYEHNVDQSKVTPFPFRWHKDPLCGRFYGLPSQGLVEVRKPPKHSCLWLSMNLKSCWADCPWLLRFPQSSFAQLNSRLRGRTKAKRLIGPSLVSPHFFKTRSMRRRLYISARWRQT